MTRSADTTTTTADDGDGDADDKVSERSVLTRCQSCGSHGIRTSFCCWEQNREGSSLPHYGERSQKPAVVRKYVLASAPTVHLLLIGITQGSIKHHTCSKKPHPTRMPAKSPKYYLPSDTLLDYPSRYSLVCIHCLSRCDRCCRPSTPGRKAVHARFTPGRGIELNPSLQPFFPTSPSFSNLPIAN